MVSNLQFEFDIDELLARYPLADDFEDIVMNKTNLATALGKSTNTIDEYVRKGMPVKSAGTNGSSYEFQLSHCYAWYMGWKQHDLDVARKQESVAQQLRLSLLNDDEGEFNGLTPSQQRDVYKAEQEYMTTAEFRRLHCKRADVEQCLEKLFAILVRNLQGLPDVMERELGLDTAQVERAVRICDNQISLLNKEISNSDLMPGSDDQTATDERQAV